MAYRVGERNGHHAFRFIKDIRDRVLNRIQLTSDGSRAYQESVENAFCLDVDYAQLIKVYGPDRTTETRHSPAVCLSAERKPICGDPDWEHISTSYVERQNLTMRMSMRRFTRLTNAFSKKLDNMKHAVALNFMYYNYCRIHKTLRLTPAMESGLTDHVWEIAELVQLVSQ